MPNEEQITITETDADGNETDFEIVTAKVDDLSGDDQAFAAEAIEALFDGEPTDQEASYMDYDGDGKLDTAGADTDGDGQIDTVAADTDGDGKIDAVGLDTDGDGQIDTVGADTDGDGTIDAVGRDTDGDGQIDVAVFDTDGDGEVDTAMMDTDGDGEMEIVDLADVLETDDTFSAEEGLPTEEEISTNSVEFTVGEDMFPDGDAPFEMPGGDERVDSGLAPNDNEIADGGIGFSPEYSVSEPAVDDPSIAEAAEAAENAGQQAHAEAAGEAQTAADEFIEKGDYAAAAEARQVAENESWEAGDNSMLGASDSSDLEYAADRQDRADDYKTQQAEHIAEGDFVAAKEDAQNAAYETGDADFRAGGADHTGQSDNDAYNLDWAAYQDKNADQAGKDAEYYAAQGDFDRAEISADRAEEYGASAVDYADKGDPTSINNDFDPSAVVETGGSYDASTYDAGFDASAGVDTGFDSSVDMSTPTPDYDTTPDDNM